MRDGNSTGHANHGGSQPRPVPTDADVSNRRCPWCNSDDTRHTLRGYVGQSNDRDQYLTCNRCRRLTYEIVSRTPRDIRLGQFQVGDLWRDHARQTQYVITRILKAGASETLLYVRPVVRSEPGVPS
jgi:hypothetical protein